MAGRRRGRDAALALADRLTSEAEGNARLRQSMDARAVATALNALSKWPDKEEARKAALRLAERVSSEPQLCQSMDAQAVTNALNALSKWPDEAEARAAALVLADRLTSEAEGMRGCASRWTRRPWPAPSTHCPDGRKKAACMKRRGVWRHAWARLRSSGARSNSARPGRLPTRWRGSAGTKTGTPFSHAMY
ncbi:hypothetical protein KAF44_26245 (plasmid) [Cupriavidus necator]|nr:hypothetical protein KAF44_26245 [Cupriavidus necator]